MVEIEIRTFAPDDADGVISVILPIQREEFGIDITADAQPDLRVIPDFYQSGKGQFWVAVKDGAIVAFTVEEKDGKTWLEPAWISRDMNRAEPPVIANGIVFAYGNGENTDQSRYDVGLTNTAEERIAGSTHAVLYALDARTGKELWSSGDEITSFNHWSGLSIANGKVYIATFDGIVYCYGIPR